MSAGDRQGAWRACERAWIGAKSGCVAGSWTMEQWSSTGAEGHGEQWTTEAEGHGANANASVKSSCNDGIKGGRRACDGTSGHRVT